MKMKNQIKKSLVLANLQALTAQLILTLSTIKDISLEEAHKELENDNDTIIKMLEYSFNFVNYAYDAHVTEIETILENDHINISANNADQLKARALLYCIVDELEKFSTRSNLFIETEPTHAA